MAEWARFDEPWTVKQIERALRSRRRDWQKAVDEWGKEDAEDLLCDVANLALIGRRLGGVHQAALDMRAAGSPVSVVDALLGGVNLLTEAVNEAADNEAYRARF